MVELHEHCNDDEEGEWRCCAVSAASIAVLTTLLVRSRIRAYSYSFCFSLIVRNLRTGGMVLRQGTLSVDFVIVTLFHQVQNFKLVAFAKKEPRFVVWRAGPTVFEAPLEPCFAASCLRMQTHLNSHTHIKWACSVLVSWKRNLTSLRQLLRRIMPL